MMRRSRGLLGHGLANTIWRMRIEFQLTHDDYAEGTRHRRIDPVLMAVLLWTLPLLMMLMQILNVLLARAGPAIGLFLFLTPLAGALGAAAVMGVHGAQRIGGKPWRRRYIRGPLFPWLGNWSTHALLLILGLAMGMVAASLKQLENRASNLTPLPFWMLLIESWLPLIPGLIGVGAWLAITPYILSTRRLWQRQLHLQRPCTAEITETSLRLSEPLSSREYLWDYFPGFTETPNEFVIYMTPTQMEIIPKRAFPDSAQRQSFLSVLEHRISDRTAGFPIAAALPLPPVQPLVNG
jgi:hypothetical protein